VDITQLEVLIRYFRMVSIDTLQRMIDMDSNLVIRNDLLVF